MQRILSGIKPSGNLHLGNYLGAIQHWVQLQEKAECLYCVVDMHAITVWQDPEALRQQTYEIIAGYLACGLDPSRSALFCQSHVPAHAQLAWIFNCVARVGWMNRMTQFKDKAGKNKENASLGLYAYPSLMAADILIYQTTHVPVGEDQKQHVELARDIGQKFNHDYKKELFVLPEPMIQKESARIMSLRDGTSKMSKSDGGSDYACIYLMDTADDIALKIRKAKTDPESLPSSLDGFKGRPEAKNLVNIYAALKNVSFEDALKDVGGQSFSDFKGALTDLMISVLDPIREKMEMYLSDRAQIDRILKDGADKASSMAEPVLHDVYDTVGFLSS